MKFVYGGTTEAMDRSVLDTATEDEGDAVTVTVAAAGATYTNEIVVVLPPRVTVD